MQTLAQFRTCISKSFWDAIHKESIIPYLPSTDRILFCDALYGRITRHTYSPGNPRNFLVYNKGNSIARLVPIFSEEDYCTYYYCVKVLEDFLAEGYIEGTFGGFRLSGAIRTKENDMFNITNEAPYIYSDYLFNRFAWTHAWKEFTRHAFELFRDESLEYFITFDIANFYDSINLALLEKRLRESAENRLGDEIDLLFFFLRYCNKKFSLYFPQAVGLPQDEMGECSRLLANYYLQPYDKEVHDYAAKMGSKYLRYADDQVLLCPNRRVAEDILFFASKAIRKIGLNINASKVRHLDSRLNYETYWAFEINDLLGNPEDAGSIEKGAMLYLALQRDSVRNDGYSILKRLINSCLGVLSEGIKSRILLEAMNTTWLEDADPVYVRKIINNLSPIQQEAFRELLLSIALAGHTNVLPLRLIKISGEINLSQDKIQQLEARVAETSL